MTSYSDRAALIAGAGGFIGGHLTRELLSRGYSWVRCVDIAPTHEWHQLHDGAENMVLDLRDKHASSAATSGVTDVFNLACDMGGIGFIENHKAECMVSVLINTHLLMAAAERSVERYFYSSSACVYNGSKQSDPNVTALREDDAYPAEAEDGYGWEKLFSERMCRHFHEDYGLDVRVARFHNVYGPDGTYDGGREKAPAAICRKVAQAKLTGKSGIEIWGDGEQTRSFMYVDDCIEGMLRLHESGHTDPINLGSSELVTINRLVDLVAEIGGVELERSYDLDAPKGVRGRNSDNTRIREILGWEPSVPLREGLEKTYAWIFDQVSGRTRAPLPGEETSWRASSSSISTTGPTSRARAST